MVPDMSQPELFTPQTETHIRALGVPSTKGKCMKSKKKPKADEKADTGKHVTDRKLLERIGTDLFGARWQSELGRALGVNLRTTRRWFSGHSMIGPEFWENMEKVMDRRLDKLNATRAALQKKVASL